MRILKASQSHQKKQKCKDTKSKSPTSIKDYLCIPMFQEQNFKAFQ